MRIAVDSVGVIVTVKGVTTSRLRHPSNCAIRSPLALRSYSLELPQHESGSFARTFSVNAISILFVGLLLATASRSLCQGTTKANPDIVRLAEQAESDLHNQKLEQAAAEYQKILAIDPNNISAHSNLGLANYLQGKFAPAAIEFRTALRLKPDLWNIAALCGLSEAKTADNTGAAVHLEQAFQHVTVPSLRIAVGKQLFSIVFEAGELNRAAGVVEELRRLDPANIDVLYAAHQVYSLLADNAFMAMAQVGPDSARMYQLRGDRMAQIGNMQGAVAAYRLAIERDPHLSGVHFALGEVLSISRNADERAEAENEYVKALQDNPLDEKAECRLGDIEMQRSNLKGAVQHYQRALQLQPNDPDANEGYGMALLASDSSQAARSYLSRAVQLDRSNVTAYYHLSEASRKSGDLDAAKREMEEFLKLKAQRVSLKRSFDDLPLHAARQSGLGQEVQAPQTVAPQGTTEGNNKSNP
jgi:cytochrome c-type biogenesis protein CcmH/NrfG